MSEGRDQPTRKLSHRERIAVASERQAEATEALLALARRDFEQNSQPPEPQPTTCAGCGKLNPVVSILGDNAGSGPIDALLMLVETHCCNTSLYAVPIEFITTPSKEIAKQLIEQKGGNNGNDRNDT